MKARSLTIAIILTLLLMGTCYHRSNAQFYIDKVQTKKKVEKVGWAIDIRKDSVFLDFEEYKAVKVLNVSRIGFNTVYELESDSSKVFLWKFENEIRVYERFQKRPESLTVYKIGKQ